MPKKQCAIEDCQLQAIAKGRCQRHYQALRLREQKAGLRPTKYCTVEGCDRPLLAKGMCASHYQTKRMTDQRAAVRRELRFCEECGASLVGRRPNTKFCDVVCKERALGKRKQAKPDYKEREARRYQENADVVRVRMLRWAYDLTPEAYDALLAEQGGGCAICGVSPEGLRRHAVDHDHNTRKIRGLLCGNCNQGIGRFNDDPALLQAAISYLVRE